MFWKDKGGFIVDNEKWSVDTDNTQSNNTENTMGSYNRETADTVNTANTLNTSNRDTGYVSNTANSNRDTEENTSSYTVQSDNANNGFVTTMPVHTESENTNYEQNRREYYNNNVESREQTGSNSSYGYTGTSGYTGANGYTGTGYSSYGYAGATGNNTNSTAGNSAGDSATYAGRSDVQHHAYDRTVGQDASRTKHSHRRQKALKKKNSFLKKVACFVMAAVVFGGVAGGTMVGVNYAAQKSGLVASTSTNGESKQTATLSNSEVKSTSTAANTSALDVSDIVENVLPSVVAITNSQLYENYSQNYGDWYRYFFGDNYGSSSGNSSGSDDSQEYEAGSGSGIIISQTDDELLIVTNNHVIEDANSLTITFADSSTAKAQVKGTDSDTDIAVIAVQMSDLSDDTKSAIKVATLGDSEKCKAGEGVVAIGNALGYGQSVTVGYISALNRTISTDENTTRTVLQTDAAINPGNSGGALINMNGEVIGINCAKYSDTDVEGVGYAIPISMVKDQIDSMMNQKTRVEVDEDKQGYLGIYGLAIDSSSASLYGMPTGVFVDSIVDGSPASQSDLKEKDIITKLDGQTVSTQKELQELLKYYEGGTKVDLTVQTLQDGQYVERTVTVTLGYAKDKDTSGSNSNSNSSNQ
jgi:serine protease Do